MPFTVITANTSLNDLNLARQVYQACMHRRGALRAKYSNPDYDPLPNWTEPDTDTKMFQFIENAQSFVYEVHDSFHDPSEHLAGRTSQNLTPLDLFEGDSTTGKPSGVSPFRRVPDGDIPPTHEQWSDFMWSGYSHGKIQRGDIAGPWLWEDLFHAISRLTRVVDGGSYTTTIEKREDDSYAEQASSPPPYAALPGNVVLAVTGAYADFFHVFMRRIVFGGTTAEMNIQVRVLEKEYYSASGVTATNKLVVMPVGSFPGSVFGYAPADIGRTATRNPISTRFSDDRYYFTAAFISPSALIGVSRESIINSSVPWGGIHQIYAESMVREMVTDYVFPDGII
jgi:hypothetical protein